MLSDIKRLGLCALASVLLLVGISACGSSKSSSSSGLGQSSSSSGAGQSSPGALSAEAKSAASGDIPDTQVFVTLRDPAAGFSIQYPEGWTQRGSGANVTLQDKNNLVRIVVHRGSAPTATAVSAELAGEKRATPSLQAGSPQQVSLKGARAIKVSYSTQSAPNPVTGKRVLLLVDRYVLSNGARYAVVDLGSPKGVDNVDAYRMMIGSFRWQ